MDNSSGLGLKEPESSSHRVRPGHGWLLLETDMIVLAGKTLRRRTLLEDPKWYYLEEKKRGAGVCSRTCEEIVWWEFREAWGTFSFLSKVPSPGISRLHNSLWLYPVSSSLTCPPPFPKAKGAWGAIKILRSKLNQFLQVWTCPAENHPLQKTTVANCSHSQLQKVQKETWGG